MIARLTALLLALAPLTAARADVKLHELFTDNMVLQAGQRVPVWGTADPGEEVTVAYINGPKALRYATHADKDGRWQVMLPKMQATDPDWRPTDMTVEGKNTITLKNVLIGEVWVCSGQSNMQWGVFQSHDPEGVKKGAKDPGLRLYSVPRTTASSPLRNVPHDKDPRYNFTRWVECDGKTVEYFSAVAYHFGKHLRQTRKVPIGLIHTSWGGTPAESWTSRESLDAVPELRYYHEELSKSIKNYNADKAKEQHQQALAKWEKDSAAAKAAGKQPPRRPAAPMAPGVNNPWAPSSLYNAMIAPLIPYGIAGAIWYQGESNAYPSATMSAAERAHEYRTLFPAMIKDWRKNWGQGDFPFLFVQLAPFEAGEQAKWPDLREAQFLTLALPRTGMAVITDVGDAKDIHPAKKGPVGERLALAARAIAYGEQIEYSGPVFESMTVVGNKAVLKFAHARSGLEAAGGKLTGFTLAGDDQKFVEATAEITGPDTVTVSAPSVTRPAAVRYGWANHPKVNLANKAGLPATPFRTDNFPLITPKTGGK